jgi:transcriptional regulator with XRE-family HTH domain
MKIKVFNMQNVLKNIKELRRKRKIGQKDIAEKLSLSTSGYVKIENGENVLSVERFLEICQILDVKSYNEILPQINIDSVHRVELALMNAARSFEVVKQNSIYAYRLIDTLIERFKKNEHIDKEDLLRDLELTGLYFETMQKESTRNGISLSDAKNLINNID